MRRTKTPLKRTKPVGEWYIGMEYLPRKFGTVKGPYSKLKVALHVLCDHHHCLLHKVDNNWFLTHRKNTGKWKALKQPQPITMEDNRGALKRGTLTRTKIKRKSTLKMAPKKLRRTK